MSRAEALINCQAIHHNLSITRQYAPKSKILAMVKGNAYGHGLVTIGKLLNQVESLGVACLDEAILLREAGITIPIVLMSGVYNAADLKYASLYHLDLVIHEHFQLDLLDQARNIPALTTWLKIDTGMHRLGFAPKQFQGIYQWLAQHKKVAKVYTMTHLADADNISKATTLTQLEVFRQTTQGINCPTSIANSAGLIAWPNSIAHWNRPGIMLYGLSPMRDCVGAAHGLLPVMTLQSRIIALHDLKKSDCIGYGGQWCCPEDMRIAVVSIGYGDGYPRHAKSGCPTLVRGMICPLIGRVSMDMITIDLRNCPAAEIGDKVILWGNGLPTENVAKYADTIAYDLVCSVSRRVTFIYQ